MNITVFSLSRNNQFTKNGRFSNLQNNNEYPSYQSYLTLEEFFTEVIHDEN